MSRSSKRPMTVVDVLDLVDDAPQEEGERTHVQVFKGAAESP
jgi:hypothetical protein